MQPVGLQVFCFEGYTLDLARGCLHAGGREIHLRAKSFQVLRHLVENAGRLISKDELIKTVWPNVIVTDESLTRCLSDVRIALGDSGQRIIKTTLRRGYRFAAPVAVIAPRALASCAGVASSGFQSSNDRSANAPCASVRRDPSVLAPHLSLVVLPFENLGADPTEDYIADIITDGLTTYLSRIHGTFIIARTTALAYKARAFDVRQLGRELGVRYVLEGSEQHDAVRLRVSARLIDTQTGGHLWADQFDTDRTELLPLQDLIATRLARALQIELLAVEAARSISTRTGVSDAVELALRGEAIVLRYGTARAEAEAGYALCERALALDQDNVRALSILAEKFATRVTALQSSHRDGDLAQAEELASRALAASPASYQAHHARARLLVAQKRASDALIEAERSLALNPSFIPTYLDQCQASLYLGRPEESIAYAERAMCLSPLDPYVPIFHAHEGYARFMMHDDDRAIWSLQQALASHPEFPTATAWLAGVLALNAQERRARELLKRYLGLRGTRTKTISQWKSLANADNPVYSAFRERLYEGLRKAGMLET
jgi:adenylate cyclase